MSSYYVIRTGRRMYFFYRSERNLMYRTLDDNRLSPENCLLKETRRHFSVTLNHGELVLFCQEAEGGLRLLRERDDSWSSRSLNLRQDTSEEQGRYDMLITPMLTERGLCIVYNTQTEDGAIQFLVARQSSESGEWQPGVQIDRFVPLGLELFETQSTAPAHMLMFYQTRTAESGLGYREITPSRFGNFQRVHNTTGNYTDTSYLTTADTIHALFIIKSLFSCQLFYRQRREYEFSAPILLWEAPRIDQCLLTFVQGELYATCMAGNQLYVAASSNSGVNFTRMMPYTSKFCSEPVKAVFINEGKLHTGEFFVRHVYVDRYAPWDVQMLPDLYDAFYSFPGRDTQQDAPSPPQDVLRELQERLYVAQQEIKERDHRILELMYQMKTK